MTIKSEKRVLDIRLRLFGAGVTQHSLGDYIFVLEPKKHIRRKLFGEEHSETADSYLSVGATQHPVGDYNSAIEFKKGALEIRRKLFAELRSLPAGPEPAHDPIRLQSLILLARSTPSLPSPQSSVASDVEVLATANTKRKNLALSLLIGLRKKRTNFLKRGPPNSVSCGEFHKEEKIKIWNDIYSLYKERCPESQRMLQQVKNLEYEFKQFKQRSRSTGEDGIQKIKEGFPISTSLLR
ncbi:hypothetical protein ACROYT_G005693 [Oculina patagonica]